MLLAFNLADIVTVPFGMLLTLLYRLTTNYGVALILFAVLVKLITLPMTAKGKKSSMKMSRLTPRVQEIKDKYPDDQAKQSQAMQALYKSEGVSMFGGCLWSLVPLLILIPLYSVIRHPIEYMLRESAENATAIVNAIAAAAPELLNPKDYYAEMIAARHIPDFVEVIREAVPNISEVSLQGVNFHFLGIDLGQVPQLNVFAWESASWANIGLLLIPLLSAGSQMLGMVVSNKMNQSLVTDKNGVHDAETAKSSQQQQTGKVMMWIMPLMSLWIGFTVSAALSLYWLVQGVVSVVTDILMTNHYRKIYDAEDAERLRKAMEAEALEAEKERQRAERRAANPDGITANTSKKKLQQKQKAEEQAARAAAAKEYAARKGIPAEEKETPAPTPVSGNTDRPYSKGRAYDPNRYRETTTEE